MIEFGLKIRFRSIWVQLNSDWFGLAQTQHFEMIRNRLDWNEFLSETFASIIQECFEWSNFRNENCQIRKRSFYINTLKTSMDPTVRISQLRRRWRLIVGIDGFLAPRHSNLQVVSEDSRQSGISTRLKSTQ